MKFKYIVFTSIAVAVLAILFCLSSRLCQDCGKGSTEENTSAYAYTCYKCKEPKEALNKQLISKTRRATATLALAIASYELENDYLPDTLEQLNFPRNRIPVDAWGTPFRYTKFDEETFEVRSAGPDKIMGTEDDITN